MAWRERSAAHAGEGRWKDVTCVMASRSNTAIGVSQRARDREVKPEVKPESGIERRRRMYLKIL